MFRLLLCVLAASLLSVYSQTVTTTDGSAATIVQVVGTNAAGSTTTQIIQTLTSSPSTSSSSVSSSSTTENTLVGQLGPVNGQPPTTTAVPGAPIPYAYTTVVNGVTNVIQDTFTPTSPKTTPVTAPAIGTILGYSEFLSIYGPPSPSSHSSATTSCPSVALALLAMILPFCNRLLG